MFEHQLLPERLFGLAVDGGPRSMRPGEVIRLRFRLRNTSAGTTPAARLTFRIPGGWRSVDAAELAIPALDAGTEHVVETRAVAEIADASTARSTFQAALLVGENVLGSNCVHLAVIGRPRFAAARSAIRIAGEHPCALRVAVDVVNEGDAAAHDVRVEVPPPPGFRANRATTVASCERLLPGDAIRFSYALEPVAPRSANVRIDDATVTYAEGRVALVTTVPFVLAPELTPPEIALERIANRLDATIRIANAGWVAAREVRCSIDLPAGWRIGRGTILADGAPAALRREPGDGGASVVLPFVPARGFVDVRVRAAATRPRTDDPLVVRCGSHVVDIAVPQPVVRALRLDARPESAFVEAGAAVSLAIDAHNIGETNETIAFAIDGAIAATADVRPGNAVALVARALVPNTVGDGELASIGVTATAADGMQLAAARFEVRVLARPWLALEEVVVDGGTVRVTVCNVGATAARDVRIGAGDAVDVDAACLPPGARHTMVASLERLREGGITASGGLRLPIPGLDRPSKARVAASWSLPNSVRPGERIDVRLHLHADAAVDLLRVRPHPPAGAIYVAGSTAVNGCPLVDANDGPAIFACGGLALHDVPPGIDAEIGWSLIPRVPGDLVVAVDVLADGERVDIPPAGVRIRDTPPFAGRPNALPFHVDAATLADEAEPAPADPESEPAGAMEIAAPGAAADGPAAVPADVPTLTTGLVLDAARAGAIARVLRGARGLGVASHIAALAVLFPTSIGGDDPAVNEALARSGGAVRGVYERLFVKLRIPGYDITPFDLEDAAARRGLLDVLDAALASPAGACADETGDVRGAVERRDLRTMRDTLASAPLGTADALAAIAVLAPVGGDGGAARALGAYAARLADELTRARALSYDAFVAYVAGRHSPELDDARETALAALDTILALPR